ncbi:MULTISPECIES: PaaI family thioesterase [unclassified Minwuia]|uniref:PaaI family thioesterase n=1 Tax=unclassified Minwuia TaxID=2618799 RepID=UPI00247A2363|nr:MULTISPECIES: PaaI family thioesterase [unclassified Minwuia]
MADSNQTVPPEWSRFPAVTLAGMNELEDRIPQIRALGIEVVSIDGPVAVSRLPYQEKLVGDPETGVMHGGVITTQIDNLCAVALHSRIGHYVPCVTIDLRVEYLKPAAPGLAVHVRAECRKVTRQVAFIAATAWNEDENDPIAFASCTYMLLPERESTISGSGD